MCACAILSHEGLVIYQELECIHTVKLTQMLYHAACFMSRRKLIDLLGELIDPLIFSFLFPCPPPHRDDGANTTDMALKSLTTMEQLLIIIICWSIHGHYRKHMNA